MAEQGTVRASRSPWLPTQYVQIRASWIYSPAKAAHSHLPLSCPSFARQQEWLVNLSPASGLTYLADTHQTGALTPTHTLTTFHLSPVKIPVKVKLSTKQMLIMTAFPQTVLSHLTASSFFILVMLWCSSPFLPFPCRSISTPLVLFFLLEGSQFSDFRHKTCISILSSPLSCFLLVVILQQCGYCIF